MTRDQEQESPTPAIEQWSATGVAYGKTGKFEYEHITIEPSTDFIASCGGCGRLAYIRREERAGNVEFVTTGLRLFDVGFSANGIQRSVERLCVLCLADLKQKISAVCALVIEDDPSAAPTRRRNRS
jgi:hypothetical protein